MRVALVFAILVVCIASYGTAQTNFPVVVDTCSCTTAEEHCYEVANRYGREIQVHRRTSLSSRYGTRCRQSIAPRSTRQISIQAGEYFRVADYDFLANGILSDWLAIADYTVDENIDVSQTAPSTLVATSFSSLREVSCTCTGDENTEQCLQIVNSSEMPVRLVYRSNSDEKPWKCTEIIGTNATVLLLPGVDLSDNERNVLEIAFRSEEFETSAIASGFYNISLFESRTEDLRILYDPDLYGSDTLFVQPPRGERYVDCRCTEPVPRGYKCLYINSTVSGEVYFRSRPSSRSPIERVHRCLHTLPNHRDFIPGTDVNTSTATYDELLPGVLVPSSWEIFVSSANGSLLGEWIAASGFSSWQPTWVDYVPPDFLYLNNSGSSTSAVASIVLGSVLVAAMLLFIEFR